MIYAQHIHTAQSTQHIHIAQNTLNSTYSPVILEHLRVVHAVRGEPRALEGVHDERRVRVLEQRLEFFEREIGRGVISNKQREKKTKAIKMEEES
jgi:hypothetical protein